MVGTETFQPKHVLIATWKNVSFAGGIPTARQIYSNSIQNYVGHIEASIYDVHIIYNIVHIIMIL